VPGGIRSDRVSEAPFPFAIRQRVRFGETDMQGVVYYANYLLYAEVGRTAYLRELGLDFTGLLERGIDFTIGEASVRYRAALRFDEEYDVRVRVGDVRRVSWTFEYAVDRADGVRCADMQTVQVMLDRGTFRARRLPEELRATLAAAR
jgi:acyl-CoA thioester hydrolase